MAIKLSKDDSHFRNELTFIADAKGINIDYTLVNLYMLLRHNGIRPRQKKVRGQSSLIDIERLKKVFSKLEEEGNVDGFIDNPQAVEIWLRSNLTNMVYRGNIDKEKLSSLRPTHLSSYLVRNNSHARDYASSDQVYLMLGTNPQVKNELKDFLAEGWDPITNSINANANLDVDSLGLLQITKFYKPGFSDSKSTLNQIQPLLIDQAKLYTEDIRRILVYKRLIPRNVIIDYIKTITSFHLSIYYKKLVYSLPLMVKNGSVNVNFDWNIVIDATDDLESKVSRIASSDTEKFTNSISDYVKATYQINATLRWLKLDKTNSKHLDKALETLKNRPEKFEVYFEAQWDNIYNNLDEEDKLLVKDLLEFEDTYFDRYIELVMRVRGGYHYKYGVTFIDSISQKNSERGFMAQGRSKKHPRRYVLGTRLLETLVQILVLDTKDDRFITRSLSIEELTKQIRGRYGLIINGLSEARFANVDLNTNIAFKENMEAFKQKLRQIGFYNDMSDAYILQKVRPRYEITHD